MAVKNTAGEKARSKLNLMRKEKQEMTQLHDYEEENSVAQTTIVNLYSRGHYSD